jgi:enterochelin esterase family protein
MLEPTTTQDQNPDEKPQDELFAIYPAMSQKDHASIIASMSGDEPYMLGSDSTTQDGVPRGEVIKYYWKSEHIYPGTARDYWLYIPQQYDGTRPACLMVFQDGDDYLGPSVNASIVFDNLIHKRDIPVTIGLFVNPGDKGPGMPIWGGSDNRSFEYDSLGDQYARFLIAELLPEIEKHYKIVSDPAGRGICGKSSGGICSFTVAWERPDAFRKIISHCGSFVNIRGGHNYASLIRKTETKPIRIFLQTGANDVDLIFGNLPIANRDMAAALAYKKYDYQFVFGEGGHTLKHGGAIFPDTMRWLWRDYPIQEL